MSCEHHNFTASVEVNQMTDRAGVPLPGLLAKITVRCEDCGAPMQWLGVPSGVFSHRPGCSLDMLTLMAPMVPAGQVVHG